MCVPRIGIVDDFRIDVTETPGLKVIGNGTKLGPRNRKSWREIGHGNHVAMIIGGQNSEAYSGWATDSEIVGFNAYSPRWGRVHHANVVAGIQKLVSEGCDIINFSGAFYRIPRDERIKFESLLKDFRAQGVTLICAAGDGDRSEMGFPASSGHGMPVSGYALEESSPRRSVHRRVWERALQEGYTPVNVRDQINQEDFGVLPDPTTYIGKVDVIRAPSTSIKLYYNCRSYFELFGVSWSTAITTSVVGFLASRSAAFRDAKSNSPTQRADVIEQLCNAHFLRPAQNHLLFRRGLPLI